ncbi:MAG: hypothetical protein LIO53_09040, partial [Oscillospiraceae bacterium]|nr:hypothetical protein [Oscillospiraceae bacterium]
SEFAGAHEAPIANLFHKFQHIFSFVLILSIVYNIIYSCKTMCTWKGTDKYEKTGTALRGKGKEGFQNRR